MTDEQIALARRAVACKGWRWIPRMVGIMGDEEITVLGLTGGATSLNQTEVRLVIYQHRHHKITVVDDDWAIPDVTDAATVGCLLALVREAWEPYGTFVSTHRYDGGEWSIRTLPIPMFATEAEALIAALERAP